MKIIAVIPARYNSTRFPGKPLADICGKPMIWWVYNRVKRVEKIDQLIVATDDKRIYDYCDKAEIPVEMTSSSHKVSCNRVQEVADRYDADFYLQLNGDEPLIKIDAVSAVIPDVIPEKEYGTNIITDSNFALD